MVIEVMPNRCCKQRPKFAYHVQKTPKWKKYVLYGTGCVLILVIVWTTLRDVSSVEVRPSEVEDFKKLPSATVGSDKLDDVYWRMKVRHTNEKLLEECKKQTSTNVITSKNIYLDTVPMKESYIYRCDTSESVLNARVVIGKGASEFVQCSETYAGITKEIERKYPFSLKYISGNTFTSQTKVIRDPVDACIWLHAIDIVESRWD